MSNYIVLNQALIDWVTVSAEGQEFYRLRGYAIQNSIEGDRKMQNFSVGKGVMYTGWKTNDITYGERDNEGTLWGIIMCSGHTADYHAKSLWYAGFGSRDGSKVTRIDYQITIEQERTYNPETMMRSLRRYFGDGVGIRGSKSGGMTVAVGSRTSQRFVRIYQKDMKHEVKEYGLLRFEIEFKGELAMRIWRNKISASGTLGSEMSHMMSKMPDRSYSKRILVGFNAFLSDGGKRVQVGRKASSTMRWLREQVDPAISRMANSHDADEVQELLELVSEWVDVVKIRVGAR